MRVLFFAQARLAASRAEEQMEMAAPISSDLFWEKLVRLHPALASLQSTCRLARNGRFLGPNEFLQPDDEVAILPPVSGG